jgi:hypothetical protein
LPLALALRFVEFAHQYSIVKDLNASRELQRSPKLKKELATKGTKCTEFFVPSVPFVAKFFFPKMEMIGFEPTASAVQVRRSPN